MTDIVERLRRRRLPMDVGWLTIYEDDIECHEAADEIERLRAALHKVLGIVGNFPVDRFEYNIIKEARAALGEKD